MLLIVLIATATRPRRLWLFVSFFFHLHPFVMRLTYSRNHPGRSCTSSAAVGCQSCREGQARRAQGSQGQWHRSASWRWWWILWYRTVLSSFFSCLHLGLFFFLVFFAVSPDQTSGEESCLGPEREQGPPKNSGPPFSTTFPRTTLSQVKITLSTASFSLRNGRSKQVLFTLSFSSRTPRSNHPYSSLPLSTRKRDVGLSFPFSTRAT